MTHYGVRRLVVINSGNYAFANVDLSKPIHLAAPNNRGKSTLVNALQFLYVDDFNKMRFPKRSHDDTALHYFGQERSYLVFECLTPSGIQCMVVSGLSRLGGGRFERYIYDHEFREDDYFDNDEVRSFDAVRTILADRHLTQVKPSELWKVLGSALTTDDRATGARLNILPIRRHDEYTVFRNVFVQLLSLVNVNARDLRRLIIDAHAREISDKRIDVAAEYKDDFLRAERSEHRLNFINEVATNIDAGKDLCDEIGALTQKLGKAMPIAWNDAGRCEAFIADENKRLCEQLADARRENLRLREAKDQLLIAKGEVGGRLKAVEKKWSDLLALHEKWSAMSGEFITVMIENARQVMVEISDHERVLDQAAKFQTSTLQRQVDELKNKIHTETNALAHWDRTTVAELRRLKLSNAELDSAFRIANPALLSLIIGDSLTIKESTAVVEHIRLVARRVKEGVYSDDAVEVKTADLSGPISQLASDPEELRRQIELNTADLEQAEFRLAACKDAEKVRVRLASLQEDYKKRQREIEEHERYASAWSSHAALEATVASVKEEAANILTDICNLESQIASHDETVVRTEEEIASLKGLKNTLSDAVRNLHDELRRQHLDTLLPAFCEVQNDESTRPQSLAAFVSAIETKLVGLANDTRRIAECNGKLKQVQDRIAKTSCAHEGQVCYFSDTEEDWRMLTEARESLPQLEETAKAHWDSLVTTLGARLNLIVTAVRTIRTAVERINRGLKTYQVSNLIAVAISVEEAHDTFPAIEALSRADSLFHDPGQVEHAKKKLRGMINSNEIIELETLFELRIDIQEMDGRKHQAKSLDEIGSTGTGMTAKAMIFIHLIRAIADNEKYRLHFYIDGLGDLDDPNLSATAKMAVSKGIIPITADPRLHVEALAHPEVTVYSLGQNREGRFFIDQHRTYHARISNPAATTSNK